MFTICPKRQFWLIQNPTRPSLVTVASNPQASYVSNPEQAEPSSTLESLIEACNFSIIFCSPPESLSQSQ